MGLLVSTPKNALLNAINQVNPSLPKPADDSTFYFGKPRLDTDGVTTIVPTTGVLGSVYSGYTDFKYRKLDLSVMFDTRPTVKALGGATLYDILPAINKALGLTLTEDDVVNVELAAYTQGDQYNLPVQATTTSLGYAGSLVVQFFQQYITFSTAVKQTELNVRKYPIPAADGKLCLDMVLWSMDFSPWITENLARNGDNWQNPANVTALMEELYGWADWPVPAVNAVKLYATSAYVGANTAFQYVIVVPNVNGGLYEGTALFHYNLS